jgi:hypothetical protein
MANYAGSDGKYGVYWVGANKNVYVKGNDGKVVNQGKLIKDYGNGFDTDRFSSEAYRKIADPNPPKPNNPSSNSDYLKGLQSQLSALQAQLAYQPKLPQFDVLGNYKRARSQAEKAVNPMYEKYLKDFLAKQSIQKQNKKGQTKLAKESNALELGQTLGESEVTRGRTMEDTLAAIDKLNTQEGEFQQDSGTQFDIDRRANAEQIAAAGMTTSGLGAQNMYDQETARNIGEERQVVEFNNQREAKKLFQARTFEDLARGDENAKAVSAQRDKEAQFDLDAYLRELAADETQFRTENELKRLTDISQQATTYERKGSQEFLASLAGAGWRPQDIALAYQVYG